MPQPPALPPGNFGDPSHQLTPQHHLDPDMLTGLSLGVLERDVLLPAFVTRLAGADFRGHENDTINMRIPAYTEAREYEWRNDRAEPIILDQLTETSIPVKLDTHLYSALAITDEQLTLDVASFGEQVLAPQVRALTRRFEEALAYAVENAPIAWTVNEADPYLAAAKARAALNKAGIPLEGRALILGADVETAFLSTPLLVRADTSGSTSALRDANIGRIAGFETYVSMFIDPDTAYAVHRSAIALANMAPVVPDGVTWGRSQVYNGYAVRWIRDYDPMYLRDRSVLSTFIGASSVNDGAQLTGPMRGQHDDENVRIVKITGIRAGTPAGG